jgi:predicted RNase H-like HicB family nuclease
METDRGRPLRAETEDGHKSQIPISKAQRFHRVRKGGGSVTTKTFTAVLHREEDMYVSECPEVGTVSQGATVEEALANLKEATELYLEEFPLGQVDKPLLTTFEVAVNA